jgi:hypothetical protein
MTGDAMQMNLPMLTVYEGPTLVEPSVIKTVKSYREAVQTCWLMRKRRNMTMRSLAEEAHLYPSHVTSYLSAKDGQRDLPASYIADFEVACGNRCITQWLTAQADLTILESLRRAA